MNPLSNGIRLEPQHIDFSDALGIKRNDYAIANNKARHGVTGTPAQTEWMNIVGARAECAGYLWLRPVLWNRWTDESIKMPDLDCFIDVKGRDRPGDDIFVHEDDPPDWAFLLISARKHPLYTVIGWRWASEVQKPRNLAPHLRKEGEAVLYKIEPPHRPPVELINVLWQREMADDIYADHSSSTVQRQPRRT
jgi:hypothetical protein